jgi:protein-S-isoprenylcysteine O-methyltransferase Ste14
MRRFAVLTYGTVAYLVFFVSFLYLVGFIANWVVPASIDAGEGSSFGAALAVNCGLLLLFGLQHSVMARPGFKRWWTRMVPGEIERSTYVLATVVALVLLFWQWRPMPEVVWQVQGAPAIALQALYGLGLATVLYATVLIDHFDLFGLRQVFLYWRGTPYQHHPFQTPSLYRFVRHPLYVGWLTVLWATPVMTAGHLLLAGVWSLYIFVAVFFEERDLIAHFGDVYRRYRHSTPPFLPLPR